MTAATLSKISPIWASVTISGGLMAMASPDVRNMMPWSWKPFSSASIAALADGVGLAGEIDAGHQADGADVEHVRQALQAHRRLRPDRLQLRGAREQIFVAIEIERGETGGAGERMRRIGIAVEQLDDVIRARS